jgi:hypothetical protein
MCNETKAYFLGKTEVAPLCSAEMHGAVDDGVEYGRKACGELAMARSTAEMATVAEELRPAPFANLNCREQLRAVPSPLPFPIQVMVSLRPPLG